MVPRQISMYLARKHTNMSLLEIGGFFGGRDHTTVLHGIDKISKLYQEDAQLRSTIQGLEQLLNKVGR